MAKTKASGGDSTREWLGNNAHVFKKTIDFVVKKGDSPDQIKAWAANSGLASIIAEAARNGYVRFKDLGAEGSLHHVEISVVIVQPDALESLQE